MSIKRKSYIILARHIAAMPTEMTKADMIDRLCVALAEDNSEFDQARFAKLCGISIELHRAIADAPKVQPYTDEEMAAKIAAAEQFRELEEELLQDIKQPT